MLQYAHTHLFTRRSAHIYFPTNFEFHFLSHWINLDFMYVQDYHHLFICWWTTIVLFVHSLLNKRSLYSLLMGMKTKKANIDIFLEISLEIKNRSNRLQSFHSRHIPRRLHALPEDIYTPMSITALVTIATKYNQINQCSKFSFRNLWWLFIYTIHYYDLFLGKFKTWEHWPTVGWGLDLVSQET